MYILIYIERQFNAKVDIKYQNFQFQIKFQFSLINYNLKNKDLLI